VQQARKLLSAPHQRILGVNDRPVISRDLRTETIVGDRDHEAEAGEGFDLHGRDHGLAADYKAAAMED
jgi:hypothetical protein